MDNQGTIPYNPYPSPIRPWVYVPEEISENVKQINIKINAISNRNEARDRIHGIVGQITNNMAMFQGYLTKQDKVEFKQFITEVLEQL